MNIYQAVMAMLLATLTVGGLGVLAFTAVQTDIANDRNAVLRCMNETHESGDMCARLMYTHR